MRYVLLACAAMAMAFSAASQPLLPTSYNRDIPTIESVLGHDSGAEITTPVEAISYLESLQAAAPERMQVVRYATSWEGRELVYAIIGSVGTMARIDAVKADLAQLASGTLSASERDEIVARTPAVVWLAYGVHGNEISSTDASLALAYHLLAAEGDGVVDAALANTIVIIDPMQNPDGRNRFVNSFEAARGLLPQGDRYAAEHDEPWPSGRPNHYLFDLNRDWFALTQPETRGKVAAMQEWHPVVVADVHEMGGDQTYFFPPAARPFNPEITDAQKAKQTLIGQNHARWFDGEGIEYFTREVFDAFYPGYGDMWPALNGAIAMTYEQASSRGLVWDRTDGRQLSYREGVRAHFLSSLSTVEAVARNKALFLGDYAQFRTDAIDEGRRSDERYFVFDLAHNRWQAERTSRQLVAQGIVVRRLARGSRACGADYAAGALVVDTAQPTGRLARTLLARNTALAEDFVTEQEDRRDRGLNAELYDVTAWSVPLMAGLEATACARVDLSDAAAVDTDAPIGSPVATRTGSFGYAVPWTDAGQAKLVLAALAEGLSGKTTDEAFTMDGRIFPRGTVIFSRKANPGEAYDQLENLAGEVGAELVGLTSSWVSEGPNLGSSKFHTLRLPKVALAWGDGVRSLDAGAVRYVLEQKFGLAVTPIRTGTLPRADLDLYDVLILPEGRFGNRLDDAVKAYVEQGGIVVGFGSALRYLAGDSVGLLSTKRENALGQDGSNGGDPDEDGPRVTGTLIEDDENYRAEISADSSPPDFVPGVLLNTIADEHHWLSAGYERAVTLLTGADIYTPLVEGDGVNVFRFAPEPEILASGYLWEENGRQLAYKPFVMAEPTGEGLVVGFTQSPVVRAYLDGLDLALLNAVLLGPAHVR